MEKILKLSEVVVDNRLNPREGALDQEAITEYAANVEALPAMHVFKVEDTLYLTRGFHRFAAHQLAEKDEANFVVHEGTWEEAQEDADLDNLHHGLRLTRLEKRKVIGRYLKRHPEYSDARVAEACYTTDKTVRSVREALEEASEIPRLEKLVGVDGVERPRNIEARAKVEELPEPTPDVIEDGEPKWLADDGFNGGAKEQGSSGAGEPRPETPPPPPPPKLPPPPPPVIRESTELHISVRVLEGKWPVILATRGTTTLETQPVELGEIGAEVQRVVDEVLAIKEANNGNAV